MAMRSRASPREVVDAYPAHLHLNLLPGAQGKGVGLVLLKAWLELASKRGAAAVHVGVNRAGLRALRFWSQNRFKNPEGRAGSRLFGWADPDGLLPPATAANDDDEQYCFAIAL
jgi:GNAT superfamily N-acetyltransferase